MAHSALFSLLFPSLFLVASHFPPLYFFFFPFCNVQAFVPWSCGHRCEGWCLSVVPSRQPFASSSLVLFFRPERNKPDF
ncbi:hypothetical protein V8C42DRAFT_307642 [Trichoderma barbatum]